MQLSSRLAAACLAGLIATAYSGAASAAYAFDVSTAGDASIMGTYPSFTIYGADNLQDTDTLATYSQVFDTAQTVSFDWTYLTHDLAGGAYDPAGYLLNGVYTRLSPSIESGVTATGHADVSVAAGDTFGWYVNSLDSSFGRASFQVAVSAVPEPAGAALLLAGLAGLGVATRRRSRG